MDTFLVNALYKRITWSLVDNGLILAYFSLYIRFILTPFISAADTITIFFVGTWLGHYCRLALAVLDYDSFGFCSGDEPV